MTKFNLKEHIAKNKATFFGSLTEGQFSWMTQDTGQQIGSQDENKIPVYMFDDKGKYYYEKDYDGYGVFGGMDYYELLDKMNGGSGDRSRGIDLAFNKEETSTPILFPALITRPGEFNYKTHDFTKEAEHDPNQSWYDASYEDEDFIDQNDEEVYGYDDEDEELEEGFQGQFYAPEYLEQKYGKEMASKITDEIDEMDENSWDRFTEFTSAEEVEDYISDIKDMLNLNEGEAAYEYEKGKEAGEKIEKKKMKVSEFKSKIKEMILAEMNVDVTDETSGYDFLAELEGMLDEAEGLTPLQDYVYQYEIEISGEDQAQDFLDDIRKLNTPQDVYDYYAYDRDWSGSMDDDLENIYRQVKRKFKNLNEAEGDKHVVMKGNKFYTGTEFVDDMEDAMKYNLKSATEIAKEKKGMVYTPKAVKEAKKDEEVEDEVDIDIESPEAMDAPMGGINVTQNADADLTGTEKELQDNLEAALEAAKKIGDDKLQQQIGNSLTFFTRQHVVKEDLNEGLGIVSAITILIASLLLNPITGPLLMGLFKYIFQDLPEQRAKAKELKTYNGPDKKEQVLALAKEIESQLSPGKKKYLTSLVNAIGKSKLEDEAKAYQELDLYSKRQKNLMDRELNENLATDIEAALEDLPIPMDMEEETLNESMFPMLKKILK
jgi:hypothetical protein